MVDLSAIANAPIKIIFLVHLILTTWGIQGAWSPDSYLFYNLIFLALLLGALHHTESAEPVQLGLVVSSAAVVLDIIVLIGYFPHSYSSSERFSVGMAILNLVIRPVSSLVLYKVYVDRASGGVLGTPFPNNFGEIFSGAGGQQRTYEDIDTHQSVPRSDVSSPAHYSPNEPKMPPPYHG